MRALQRANDGAGRLLSRPLSSAQHRHWHSHVPAVTSTSFVRSLTGTVSADERRIRNGGAPSPLHRQLVHANDRCFNARGFGPWNARGIHGVRRRMTSSVSAEPATKPDQSLYFEGPWYEKYLLLEEYKKEHGNCLVPYSFVCGGVKLGHWVGHQRIFYKKGQLSQNRREMLAALGFSWYPRGDQWERNFGLLEQFQEREGHCDVPALHEEDGVKLGKWLNNQRTAMKRGKLDESNQGRLEELGVSFDPHRDQWERYFALLVQFQKRNGHCGVPALYEEDGVKLGIWIANQREIYKKGKLDESLRRRLEKLGISWDPLADQWERTFALLEQFKDREGHCNVPQSYEEDGISLGAWLCTQRMAMKRGKLDESYQRRLEKLGVSWDVLADQWKQNFSLLEQFKEREGHCNVPAFHEEDGVKLGAWLVTQRTAMKQGKLDESYQGRLKELGVSFDPHRDQWERNFALLEQYQTREGDCNVSLAHEENGIMLGKWLSRQRTALKKGKLDESYQRRLEELGMIWDPLKDQWEQKFSMLEQFKAREGHCNVPFLYEEDGVNLGNWLDTQRMSMKKGKLNKSYQRRLEDLDVCWDVLEYQWERNFALLGQFIEREGHCNVPQSHEEDGIKLGKWLSKQRQARKGNQCRNLSSERIERLNKVGIRW